MPVIHKFRILSIGMPSNLLKARDDFGNKIIKPVLEELLFYWHAIYLPGHFRPGAAQKYRYDGRTVETLRNKKRMADRGRPEALLPLIMTGTAKRMVTGSMRVSGTAKKMNGYMPAPRYVSAKVRPTHPNMAMEITAVTQEEADELAKRCEKMMVDRMNENTDRAVETISA